MEAAIVSRGGWRVVVVGAIVEMAATFTEASVVFAKLSVVVVVVCQEVTNHQKKKGGKRGREN